MFNGIVDINHNDNLDLAQAQTDGIVAVIHKVTEGATFVDPLYLTRRAQADQLGLLWGGYHFGTAADVGQQLDNFANAADLRPTDLVALDYETNSTNTMSLDQAEQFIIAFQGRFGFVPLIYGSSLLTEAAQQGSSTLASCPLWIAQYSNVTTPALPSLWPTFVLWQFTDGTSGPQPHTTAGLACDHDSYNGNKAGLLAKWPLRP
jgi:lysozyme